MKLARRIKVENLREGQWIIDPHNPRFTRRVVEVSHGVRDGTIKVKTDFGSGGEPATSFYERKDICLVGDRPNSPAFA